MNAEIDKKLNEKVIIVTGASSGIGKATALLFGRHGARLGLMDVVEPTDVVSTIKAAGGEAKGIKCDVRSRLDVEKAIRSVVDAYGPLDGAANLAGVMTADNVTSDRGSLLDLQDEEYDRIMAVNVGGSKNCLRAELQNMNHDGGSIVNAGSVSGLVGSPFNAAYGASKAAVMSLSVSVAQEMGRKGVRINAIAPGIISTPLVEALPSHTKAAWTERNALGRPGSPEEVAKMVLFLLSNDSSFCTGTIYNVDAGRR